MFKEVPKCVILIHIFRDLFLNFLSASTSMFMHCRHVCVVADLSFFLSFFLLPLLPAYCRCRGLLVHLITSRDIRYNSSGREIGPSQRPLPDNTQHSQETDIHDPGGIWTAIPASERPQTHALDRTATGIFFVLLAKGNAALSAMGFN
jgi:hypothetical protein